MSEVESFIQEYSDKLDQGWFGRVISNEGNSFKTSKDQLTKFLIDIKTMFFDRLNASILKGEYATYPTLSETLISFRNNIDKYQVTVDQDIDSRAIQGLIVAYFKGEFINVLINCIDAYLMLINEFKHRLELNERKWSIIGSNLMSNFELMRVRHHTTNNNISFFLLNLKVALCDIKMRADNEFVEFFVTALDNLEDASSYGAQKFRFVLIHKVNFLYHKLILRRYHDQEGIQYYYKSGKVDILDPSNYKPDTFSPFFEYAKNHYELNDGALRHIKNQCERDLSLQLSSLTMLQLHMRIKYYKDIRKDFRKLEEVYTYLTDKLKSFTDSSSIEERYIISVASSYAINNLLALKIEIDKSDSDKIDQLYYEAISNQNLTKVHNFFADFKYLGYLIAILDDLTNSKHIIDNIAKARDVINRAQSIIENYKEKILWCHERFNYIYALSFSECFVPVGNPQIGSLFIYSSFLLPLSKEKYQLQFEEKKQLILRYKASIDVIENINSDIKNLKEEQKNLNRRESKSMEIIGIFTAMVTFVAGTIQSFSFISTPFQAIMFAIAFGSALFLFVLLLLLSNRIEIKKRSILWFCIVALGLIFVWGTLCYFYIQWKGDESKAKPATFINNQMQNLDNIDTSVAKPKKK